MGAMRTGGSPKTGRVRRAAWIAFALAAALAPAGCNGEGPNGVNTDAEFPVGSCAVIAAGAGTGLSYRLTDCSEAHTHVVIARVTPGQTCPPGTDVVFEMSGGTRCFRADASPRPTP
jgi:hypothetical protein